MRLVLDIEGTVYTAAGPVPGAAAAIQALRGRGASIQFASNKDSTTGRALAAKLRDIGIDVEDHEVTTPTDVLRLQLEREPRTCHLLVNDEIERELRIWASKSPAELVVVGDITGSLSWQRLDEAFRLLLDGAELVALQRGRYFLLTDGRHLDTGILVEALESAAETSARLIGKPSPDFFRMVFDRMGDDAGDPDVVIGDDVDTDIAGARAIGATSILVRTGKQADRVTVEDGGADHVVASIADVPNLLDKL
jgi:HAD superfamily hydrolase (TIGR01458 family)